MTVSSHCDTNIEYQLSRTVPTSIMEYLIVTSSATSDSGRSHALKTSYAESVPGNLPQNVAIKSEKLTNGNGENARSVQRSAIRRLVSGSST